MIVRALALICLCFALLLAAPSRGATAGSPADGSRESIAGRGEPKKVALVYNGSASAEDCPEAAAAVAERAGLEVRFVSDVGELPDLLRGVAVFVIGGTGDDLHPLLKAFTPKVAEALKSYLRNGGRYLGICGGGFMASTGWDEEGEFVHGLGLIPAKSHVYRDEFDAIILPVRWQGKTYPMYFKAGPDFILLESREEVRIVARYRDGCIAALTCSLGKGRIAVCGPHPEARGSWKDDAPNGDTWISTTELAVNLLKDLLSGR